MDIKDISLSFCIEKLLPAIVVLIVGAVVIKSYLKFLKKILEKSKSRIDPVINKFVLNATKVVFWVVLILAVLKLVGVDTTSVLTLFAAAGAAIALALKDSLSNLASGIIIMVTKPFVYGDYIQCGSIEGTVEGIDLLTSTVITADNKVITAPNSQFTGGAITNFTKRDTRRVDVKIGVGYESDINAAKTAIIEKAKSTGLFLDEPAIAVNVIEHADSAIILSFRGWCVTKNYWDAYFAMQNGMKPALDAANIEIPYPQVDVHQK